MGQVDEVEQNLFGSLEGIRSSVGDCCNRRDVYLAPLIRFPRPFQPFSDLVEVGEEAVYCKSKLFIVDFLLIDNSLRRQLCFFLFASPFFTGAMRAWSSVSAGS